jgi:Xaa-Pro aminopeptidase
LLPEEIKRYREITRISAKAVEAVCRDVVKGVAEYELASRITQRIMSEGGEADVALVASDGRICKYRHPLPTDKKVDQYAMLIVCGRKYGLVASLTRSVFLGDPPPDLIAKHRKTVGIDAEMISGTITGRKISDILSIGIKAYADAGYPDEWRLHHQGGAAGYACREYLATFDSEETVMPNQAFAWNPSITGTKSEDTIIVSEDGIDTLTDTGEWPCIEVITSNGLRLKRPDILRIQ